MSVIGRESLKNPWFPGPFLIHRNQSAQDFSYFWQAVKRGSPALSNILVLGTDEDEALSGGILKETSGTTIHLLGKQHVQASVDKKLQSLNFPSLQRKIILCTMMARMSYHHHTICFVKVTKIGKACHPMNERNTSQHS